MVEERRSGGTRSTRHDELFDVATNRKLPKQTRLNAVDELEKRGNPETFGRILGKTREYFYRDHSPADLAVRARALRHMTAVSKDPLFVERIALEI